jgi:transglutaminase-like putative cysteine protease
MASESATTQYVVRHLTRFVYTSAVSESVMELRMQPLELSRQRCLRFNLTTTPRARVFAYRDHFGNTVHYFGVPGTHGKLEVTVESAVEIRSGPPLVRRLPDDQWAALDALAGSPEYLDWLLPSPFVSETAALTQFALVLGLNRDRDPLTTLRAVNAAVYSHFSYEPRTTRVDSPIDDALRARAGVCQDFAHIMAALLRKVGIPCRYVSGYIAPLASHPDRAGDNATHAWVEAYLPGLGWIGCDPTNDTIADHRHIVVAVGRDYSDVPPTRGVLKGDAGSELSVAVAVSQAHEPIQARVLSPSVSWIVPPRRPSPEEEKPGPSQQQQQQQQQ